MKYSKYYQRLLYSSSIVDGLGGVLASWLVRLTPDLTIQVWTLAGNIVLCSWATQVYKWVMALVHMQTLHTVDGLASSAKNVDWNICSASFCISAILAWQEPAIGRNLWQCLEGEKLMMIMLILKLSSKLSIALQVILTLNSCWTLTLWYFWKCQNWWDLILVKFGELLWRVLWQKNILTARPEILQLS